MGKKQKDETPNVNATPNRDIIQRLNFLYQASVYLQSLEPPIAISDAGNACESHQNGKARSKGKHKETEDAQHFCAKKLSRRKVRRKQTTGDLARSYVQCMRVVGQKTMVKIDPTIKRSLCSSCSTALIPGSSASVRVKKSLSHGHLIIYTCLRCKAPKGIPAPPTLPVNLAEQLGSSVNVSTIVTGASEASGDSSSLAMASPSQSQVQKEKKKLLSSSRPLPLFARSDGGHVIFMGNETVVLDEKGGLGLCFI